MATKRKICRRCNCKEFIPNGYSKAGSQLYRCKECARHPARTRKNSYSCNYGISVMDYEAMNENQNYCCAICKKEETDNDYRTGKPKRLAVDHCHATLKVRGLLCRSCNIGLGAFKDRIENLKAAVNYLEKFE